MTHPGGPGAADGGPTPLLNILSIYLTLDPQIPLDATWPP